MVLCASLELRSLGTDQLGTFETWLGLLGGSVPGTFRRRTGPGTQGEQGGLKDSPEDGLSVQAGSVKTIQLLTGRAVFGILSGYYPQGTGPLEGRQRRRNSSFFDA